MAIYRNHNPRIFDVEAISRGARQGNIRKVLIVGNRILDYETFVEKKSTMKERYTADVCTDNSGIRISIFLLWNIISDQGVRKN